MVIGTRISITEAKQHLGELVKRAAYGGERIVLEFRGKPQAALVSWEDLERLEQGGASTEKRSAALARLRDLRERIGARTGVLPDSAVEIAEMRERRVAYLQGLIDEE